MLSDLPGLLPRIRESSPPGDEAYPLALVHDLFDAGIISAPFAASLGGQSATLRQSTNAIRQVATASPSLALIASMPLGLAGMYGLGPEAAPPAHRDAWLAQSELVAANYRARELYAACNSEKGAGGSLAATKTTARLVGGHFALSGEKILATSGSYAKHFFSTAKVDQAELPGAGIVEFFLVHTESSGVEILDDWDGFGMRSTESQTVRYTDTPADAVMGFPNLIEAVQPMQYWYCLFAAIPLGCAEAILHELCTPMPQSPALRLRLADAAMRAEALAAYLNETTDGWCAAAGPAFAARVLRAKTYVTQESVKLCAELFALGGGRHYRRNSRIATLMADAFAGTALRPPLSLALETLSETFALDD